MPSTASHSTFLERGKACLDCRRRKVRCDGGRPCRRCQSAGHGDDCEYLDEHGPTRSQILERNIARLEARIRELESPGAPSAALNAHTPQVAGHLVMTRTGTRSGSVAWSQTAPHSQQNDWANTPHPPPHVVQTIVGHFGPHASQFGFFLHGPRILAELVPPGPQQRPTASLALQNAILLFGVHLSGNEQLMVQENMFLSRALQYAHVAPTPRHIIHNIQADVLLAHYYFRHGKFLEGMQKLNSAMSRLIGCGLHEQSQSTTSSVALPPPSDPITAGERIDALWSILNMHKCWGNALKWPSVIYHLMNENVDIPWPLEMTLYQNGRLPSNRRGNALLKAFLDDPNSAIAADSLLATRAKATALYEAASYLGVQWSSDMGNNPEQPEFRSLDHCLTTFLDNHVSFQPHPSVGVDVLRSKLVTLTIAHVAVIKLYNSQTTPYAHHKCLNHARLVVRAMERITNIHEWKYIDPFMGMLWVDICQVLITTLSGMRDPSGRVHNPLFSAIAAEFNLVLNIMSLFSRHCPLIRSMCATVQQAYGIFAANG